MSISDDSHDPLLGNSAGSSSAWMDDFAHVYDELKQLAHRHRSRGQPGATLSTTALVHEVYLRFARGTSLELRDRHHFFALASRAMRQILVDAARARSAEKRGGGAEVFVLGDGDARVEALAEDFLALDRALDRLGDLDGRLARLVELRFFVGLCDRELAEIFGQSERTVRRDWQKARAFLLREMRPLPQTR